MRAFEYVRGESEEHVLQDLHQYGAESRVLAGGQSLLLSMKTRSQAPGRLLDVCQYPLAPPEEEAGALVLDARESYRRIEEARTTDGAAPLQKVAADIADIPVRTMATLGGALCEGNPAFDMPVALASLGGQALLKSASAQRWMDVGDLYAEDGTARLEPTEMMTRIRLPKLSGATRWDFRKFRMRKMDPAAVSIAVRLTFDDADRISDAVVVLGAVTMRPTRMVELEQQLLDTRLDRSSIRAAAEVVRERMPVERAHPNFDPRYRRQMASVLLTRSLESLVGPEHAVVDGSKEDQTHG